MYAELNSWIQHETIPFDLNSPDAAIDQLVASLSDSVRLLGFGEPMHGGEEFMILRNRLFMRLVEAHGYTAIAVESSFPRSNLINQYLAGEGTYADIQETGFSHGFGHLAANRELVEWMRQYNAAHPAAKLRFYGFDSPTEVTMTDSPRQLLYFVLDYLDVVGIPGFRQRIDELLGEDSTWENPNASMDPTQAYGLSTAASQLRIEVEELISEMRVRRPELIEKSDPIRYRDAEQYAVTVRQLLNYHAVLARQSPDRVAKLLGIRDAMMADHLMYMVARESGKVLAFAHNSHLKRGSASWQFGDDLWTWFPAGAHLHHLLGQDYVVIGTGVGSSPDNGIGAPEPGTLEAHLIAAGDSARLIPTFQGKKFADSIQLPTRSASQKNPSYFPFTPRSFTDFDWLCVLNSATYTRGAPVLP